MTSAMPVQCSNQLSYEVTQLRAGQFVGLMFSRERNVVFHTASRRSCVQIPLSHLNFSGSRDNCLNCPASARIISSFDFKHRTSYNTSFIRDLLSNSTPNKPFATNDHMVHGGGQAHYYSCTGTSKQRQVKLHWFRSHSGIIMSLPATMYHVIVCCKRPNLLCLCWQICGCSFTGNVTEVC